MERVHLALAAVSNFFRIDGPTVALEAIFCIFIRTDRCIKSTL